MASSLTIIGVVTEGLDRALGRLRSLAAIYWLPWLIGTAATVAVNILFEDQLQLGHAPAWARYLVWAPWYAMSYVMLVRLLVFDRPPKRLINLEFSRATAWAALIVIIWFLTSHYVVIRAPYWIFRPSLMSLSPEDLNFYSALLGLTTWIARALLPLCFFGLIVLAASHGRPDLREHARLLRLHPLRLIVIALLAYAAEGALGVLDTKFWAYAAPELRWPGLHPWRPNIREVVLFKLSEFPLYFMIFVTESCLLAEAYRRLIPRQSPVLTTLAASQSLTHVTYTNGPKF